MYSCMTQYQKQSDVEQEKIESDFVLFSYLIKKLSFHYFRFFIDVQTFFVGIRQRAGRRKCMFFFLFCA